MSDTKSSTSSYLNILARVEGEKLVEALELKLSSTSDVLKHTKEIDAAAMAKTVVQCVDHYKMCQMHEEKLKAQLEKVCETKKAIKEKISRIIK